MEAGCVPDLGVPLAKHQDDGWSVGEGVCVGVCVYACACVCVPTQGTTHPPLSLSWGNVLQT